MDCAALGNSMLLLKTLGFFKDFSQAKEVIVKSVGKESSDKELEKVYDELYNLYRDSYIRLKDIFAMLKGYRI